MIPSRTLYRLLCLLVLLLAAGCVASSAPEVHQLTEAPTKPICRIAVLPFANHTAYAQGEVILYRIFVAELNRRGGFTVVQEGDIRKIYRQLKLAPTDSPDHEQLMVLADRLGADALVAAEIVTMREERGAKESKPELALDIRLTPAGAAKPMLTTYHHRRGEEYRTLLHFGLVNTMTELAVLVADEILDTWLANGLTPCAS